MSIYLLLDTKVNRKQLISYEMEKQMLQNVLTDSFN